MATVTIRNLDESTVVALKKQASEHGRSMEAEARMLISAAFTPVDNYGLGSRIRARFAEVNADLDLEPRTEPARAATFD